MNEITIGGARILQGHVLDALRCLPDESVNCAVTSPPYWGLRDYGIEPQVWDAVPGCAHEWGKDIRHSSRHEPNDAGSEKQRSNAGAAERGNVSGNICRLCGAWRGSLGLEPTPELYLRHMVHVFEEVRRILRGDGTCWVNLGDSYNAYNGNRGTDSPYAGDRRAKEHFFPSGHGLSDPKLKPKDLIGVPWAFAFAARAAGWWLRQDIIWAKPNPMPESVRDRCTKAHEYLFLLTKSARYYWNAEAIKEECAESTRGRLSQDIENQTGSFRANGGAKANGPMKAVGNGEKRNRRSVWEIGTEPYPEAHFATFPEKLVEPCILAGCPGDGVVLDPFLGSGTMAAVAVRLGRRAIGIELKPEYVELARARIGRAEAEKVTMFEANEIEPRAKEPVDLFDACPED